MGTCHMKDMSFGSTCLTGIHVLQEKMSYRMD